MFGIGMPELMLIFVLALLVFGPKELPKIARTIGKAMGELRRASDELRDGIQREIELAEREDKAPSPPAETVPSPTPAEAATPAPESYASQDTAGGPTDAGVTPTETVTPEPSVNAMAPASGEEAGQTPSKDTTQTTPASALLEPGHTSTQPVETRNA
jgi:Tat protein translocase TatB subunit